MVSRTGTQQDIANTSLKNILSKFEIPISRENVSIFNKMISEPSAFYREFKIPKRKGGIRTITAPYPTLSYIQKLISEHYLIKVNPSEHAFAYVKGRSVVDHARVHLNSTELLTVDIKSFFDSIRQQTIFEIYQSLGLSYSEAAYLTRISTLNGGLPQGACTSPILSNIAFYPLDVRLNNLAEKLGLKYSRYADDLAFSGTVVPKNLHRTIDSIIKSYDFELNQSKTKYKLEKSKKIITGVSISSGVLKAPKSFKRALRAEVYKLEKYKDNLSDMDGFEPLIYEKTIGKLNFVLQVEPNNLYAQEKRKILISDYKVFSSKATNLI